MAEDTGKETAAEGTVVETAREKLDRLEREIQLHGRANPDEALMPDGKTTLTEARAQAQARAEVDGAERLEANASRFREQAREEELAAGDMDFHHDPRTGVTHIVPAGEAVQMTDSAAEDAITPASPAVTPAATVTGPQTPQAAEAKSGASTPAASSKPAPSSAGAAGTPRTQASTPSGGGAGLEASTGKTPEQV